MRTFSAAVAKCADGFSNNSAISQHRRHRIVDEEEVIAQTAGIDVQWTRQRLDLRVHGFVVLILAEIGLDGSSGRGWLLA